MNFQLIGYLTELFKWQLEVGVREHALSQHLELLPLALRDFINWQLLDCVGDL